MKTQYKQFNTESQVDEWVNKFKSFFPSDDDEDKDFLEALSCYTGNANTPINRYLRSNKNLQEIDFFDNIYQKLLDNFANYQIPDNVIVYRYINKGLLKYMCPSYPPKRGMILLDKGFMSTTLLQRSITDFRYSHPGLNVLLKISIPAGTKGLYVGHLKDSLSEYEIILAPDTKLRVDNKLPIFNSYFECTVVN